jgi:hypothetical protein
MTVANCNVFELAIKMFLFIFSPEKLIKELTKC